MRPMIKVFSTEHRHTYCSTEKDLIVNNALAILNFDIYHMILKDVVNVT
jgi:hypothetical protein